jgi:2-succinyl-6-hydroxy-2,4-cyclohexadiene-1-carboxylate synthase
VPLHVEVRGSGPPLVVLHGFTQTGRLWGDFGARLEKEFSVVAVDLPGHAGSDQVRADLPAAGGLVAEAVREVLGESPCALLGYSLGARVGLHVALGTDLGISHLVFIGVTAGLEDEGLREERRAADEALADQLEASDDIGPFVDRWLRGPMFNRLTDTGAADRTERLRNSAAGLASSLRLCGTGTQVPSWDRLGSLTPPVLALAGTDDARFAGHALRVAQLAPRGAATLVPGGGHAVHLAQPAQAARLVCHWLRSVDPDPD